MFLCTYFRSGLAIRAGHGLKVSYCPVLGRCVRHDVRISERKASRISWSERNVSEVQNVTFMCTASEVYKLKSLDVSCKAAMPEPS
jgi:hypothetical protein